MITAQWAKGHGGLYRYYRRSRKAERQCPERYLLEEAVTDQCLENTRLKQERQRPQKSRENSWIEPTRRLVTDLETLGKTESAQHLPEISGVVQKIGTNRLISGKTVSFSVSEDYDFIPSLLAQIRVSSSNTSSPRSGEKSERSKWCA